MYLGDNLIANGITALVEEFRALRCNSEILLARVPNPQQFGVAELTPEGKVKRLVEKPREPKSDLALVGVYMFDASIHESVRRIKPSARGELEITDAIQDLVDRGLDVHPHIVRGWWKDTGKLEDMLEANRLILEDIVPRVGGGGARIGRRDAELEERDHDRAVCAGGSLMNMAAVRRPGVGQRFDVETDLTGLDVDHDGGLSAAIGISSGNFLRA